MTEKEIIIQEALQPPITKEVLEAIKDKVRGSFVGSEFTEEQKELINAAFIKLIQDTIPIPSCPGYFEVRLFTNENNND